MILWEEAPITELCGVQVYTFGLYCMIGTLTAVAAILVLCRREQMKKGTGTLLSCLSIIGGIIVSRLVFSVLYHISSTGFPPYAWIRITAGGWCLSGAVFGVFCAAWLCARITKQNTGKLLDITACSLPLFICAERIGEHLFNSDGFDISRQLQPGAFPADTFLAIKDSFYDGVSFLATYRIAAGFAIVLFLALVLFYVYAERNSGDLWIMFMILAGAGGILLESLRYDQFLEYSFVRFQQVAAAVLLAWGVILAGVRSGKKKKGLFIGAVFSLILAIGICIGIEFALDRTAISHYVLYLIMAAAVSAPAATGILLLRNSMKGQYTV